MAITDAAVARIIDWTVERGLAGDDELTLLNGFCRLCNEVGLDLSNGVAIIDTLHPTYEGTAFYWRRDAEVERPVVEYQSSLEGEAAAQWHNSPFFHLL
jgi:adenylate cyclase